MANHLSPSPLRWQRREFIVIFVTVGIMVCAKFNSNLSLWRLLFVFFVLPWQATWQQFEQLQQRRAGNWQAIFRGIMENGRRLLPSGMQASNLTSSPRDQTWVLDQMFCSFNLLQLGNCGFHSSQRRGRNLAYSSLNFYTPSIIFVPAKMLSQALLARGVAPGNWNTQVGSASRFLMTAARPSRRLHWTKALSSAPTLYSRRSASRVRKTIYLFAQSLRVYLLNA